MTETTPTFDTPNYEQQIDIGRPPDSVFAALTTAAGVSGWWTPSTGSGTVGGELHLTFPPGPMALRVDTALPSSKVVWTVLNCDFEPDWVGTQIMFTLDPGAAACTTLQFCHEGLTAELPCYDQCRQGWSYYLASLREFVETGVGRPGNRHGALRP